MLMLFTQVHLQLKSSRYRSTCVVSQAYSVITAREQVLSRSWDPLNTVDPMGWVIGKKIIFHLDMPG